MSHVSGVRSSHVCHSVRAAPPDAAPPPRLPLLNASLDRIRQDLTASVGAQFATADRARGILHSKIDKIETNIDSLLTVRDGVAMLREDLLTAQARLLALQNRAHRVELMMDRENYPDDVLVDIT